MLSIELIGRLGHGASVRNINGKECVSFDVAADDGCGQNKRTLWLSCLMSGNGGALLQYLTKGTQVFIRGGYADKIYQRRDGTSDIDRTVWVRDIRLLGGGQQQQAQQPQQNVALPPSMRQQQQQQAAPAPSVNDLPVDDADLPDDADRLPFD